MSIGVIPYVCVCKLTSFNLKWNIRLGRKKMKFKKKRNQTNKNNNKTKK